jgi:hypothetical protein
MCVCSQPVRQSLALVGRQQSQVGRFTIGEQRYEALPPPRCVRVFASFLFSSGIFGRTQSDWTGKGCIVVMSLAAAAMAGRRRFAGRCRYFAGRARCSLPSSLTALDDRHRSCWQLLIAVAGGMMTGNGLGRQDRQMKHCQRNLGHLRTSCCDTVGDLCIVRCLILPS